MIKTKQRHPRFYELLKEIENLHSKKSQGYGQDEDPLSNLRACKALGIEPWVGVIIRLSDKLARLQELSKGKPDLIGESVKDTLLDLSIYSLLGIILFEEGELRERPNRLVR